MSNTVIKIENLSKIYRLGEVGTGTLTHDLNRWWRMNIHKKDGRVIDINNYINSGLKDFHTRY